eukprot:jgi/Botrbrau1/18074/Bobra.0062s0060.1
MGLKLILRGSAINLGMPNQPLGLQNLGSRAQKKLHTRGCTCKGIATGSFATLITSRLPIPLTRALGTRIVI